MQVRSFISNLEYWGRDLSSLFFFFLHTLSNEALLLTFGGTTVAKTWAILEYHMGLESRAGTEQMDQ